jgi:peptidoglycan/xylan/chitin deacetylase (PgdA/CDA1 family)
MRRWAGTPRSRARAYLGQSLKTAAVAVDRVRFAAHGVVVLLYHRVGGGSGLPVDLPAELFDAQMATLAATERVVTLDAALDALACPAPPRGPVRDDVIVITFDDGTRDFAENAFPVLERHGLPAVLYVATDFIDRGRAFPAGGEPLSWRALADVVSTGLLTVGSHTHTHVLLDRVTPATVEAELDRSIDLIGARLGVTARHFAYPKALLGDEAARRAVKQRFVSAALAGTRPNAYGRTDPYRLARSPIQVADGMRWFEQKLAGGMVFEDVVRRVANRVRYAGATT